MDIIIAILAIYGLQFLITQSDGPFGIIAWMRNWLMRNQYLGVFFYKLLSCPLCSGFWAGLTVYLMTQESYKLGWALCYALAGAAVCVIIDTIHTRLLRE
jgi:hypothetical protein